MGASHSSGRAETLPAFILPLRLSLTLISFYSNTCQTLAWTIRKCSSFVSSSISMPVGSAPSLVTKRETPWYTSLWSFTNVVCYFLKPHLLYHFSWTKSVLIPLIFFNQSLLEYSCLYDVILVYCMTKWISDTYPYIPTFHLNLNVILMGKKLMPNTQTSTSEVIRKYAN